MIPIFRATFELFASAASQSLKAIRRHPFKPLFGFLFIFVTGLVEKNSGLFPGFAGGMILGLAMTFILAGFFALISLILDSKRFSLQETVALTTGIFNPLIGSLFILFIAKFLLQPILMQVDSRLWLGIIFVALFVLCNPLPEIVSRIGVGGVQSFKDAFEFMRENGPEWLVAVLLIFLPLIVLAGPVFVMSLISSNDPLYVWLSLIRYSLLVFGSLADYVPSGALYYLSQLLLMIAGMYYVFFIFIFRFALFEALNKTTRRKRVYAAANK